MTDKSTLLRKLNSQFSYLGAEIPETINIDGKTIDLGKKMDAIIEAAESHDLSKEKPGMLELRKLLDKSLKDFIRRVEDSKIKTSEAESQLEYYLGIKQAIQIIKGFSDGSLKPFRKDEEVAGKTDDKKRWLDYLKKLEES